MIQSKVITPKLQMHELNIFSSIFPFIHSDLE